MALHFYDKYSLASVYKWNRYGIASRENRVKLGDEVIARGWTTIDYPDPNTIALPPLSKLQSGIRLYSSYTRDGNNVVMSGLTQFGFFTNGIAGYHAGSTYNMSPTLSSSLPIYYMGGARRVYQTGVSAEVTGVVTNYRIDLVNTRGSLLGSVTSPSRTTYPADGVSGSYWYVGPTTSTGKGNLLETNIIAEDGTYPDDGIQDGYWWVKGDSANKAPTISGIDEDLGGIKSPFNIVYFVDDLDLTQELTVVEKINGTTVRTIRNAERKKDYILAITDEMLASYELNKIINVEISVADTAGATAYRRKTFRRINSPPVITLPLQDLGEQNEPFNFKYTVSDPENDKVNVEIKYNGKVLAVIPNVALGVEQTYTIDKLNYCMIFNGAHSLIITATDEYGANSSKNVAFSKNVHGCGYILNGDTDTLAQYIIVEATYKLFPGEEFKVQVTNNFNDPEPVWATIQLGKVYEFTNDAHVNTPAIGVRAEVLPDPKLGDSYFYSYIAKWGVRNGG